MALEEEWIQIEVGVEEEGNLKIHNQNNHNEEEEEQREEFVVEKVVEVVGEVVAMEILTVMDIELTLLKTSLNKEK